MPIKLVSDAGGSVTLDVPTTSSTYNITIPASNGTFAIVQNDGVVNFGLNTIGFSNSVGIGTATPAYPLDVVGNINTTGNITATGTIAMGSSFKRNRIINGNMVIDQRNAGAPVNVTGNYFTYFGVDRTATVKNTSGVLSVQQSSVAPSGFNASLKALVTTADAAVASDDFCCISQCIEGFNTADLGFGSASAQTVTISFWVRSNLTGTYCCCLVNFDGTRSFVSNYTINSANAWEKKTITIAGDTSGTWLTTNEIGIIVRFPLMAGTSWQQPAGSWGTVNTFGSSSQVNWMATLNNDFYITGVQLEVGTVATPYEFQMFSEQLAQCQRYYEKSYELNTAPGSQTTYGAIRQRAPTVDFWYYVQYKVAKRASPSSAVVYSNRVANASGYLYQVDGTGFPADRVTTTSSRSETGFHVYCSTIGAVGALVEFQWTVDAEL